MVFNAQHTVLPFYTDVAQQWRNATGAFYKDVPIICPKNKLLPWQITRTPVIDLVQSVKLVNVYDDSEDDITADIPAGEINYYTANGVDYIQYIAAKNLENNMACGWYYLKVYDGNTYYFSEIFVVRDFEDTSDAALSYDGTSEVEAETGIAISYE